QTGFPFWRYYFLNHAPKWPFPFGAATSRRVQSTPVPPQIGAIMGSSPRTFLTIPGEFRDVSRGNPRPHTLKRESLGKARLTAQPWRLEIVSDGSTQIQTPRTLEKKNAIDLPELEKLGRGQGRKFLKAMQCLNIPQPLGQGLWEGVPLRDLL